MEVQDMLEKAIEQFGTSDLITIMLSQKRDKEIVKKQLEIYKISKRRYKMKSTGIVRRVDVLGRIVIPKEIRRTFEIEEKDAIEIYVDENQIILKKLQPACTFCNQAKDVINYKEKNICTCCLKELRKKLAVRRINGY